MIFGEVLDRAEHSLGLLTEDARADAETVLRICRRLEAGQENSDARRELLRVVELLARRRSHAIPYATLGRAALAHLAGSPNDAAGLVAETGRTFALLGL